MGLARKRDSNEKPIVLALEAMGAVVTRLNDFGVPDLLVGYRGRTILIEVKNPSKTSKAHGKKGRVTEDATGQLTDCQVKWWQAWIGGESYVVFTPEEARAILATPEPKHVRITGDMTGVHMHFERINPDGSAAWFSRFLTADEAKAMAGALHEQAGVAVSRRVEYAREHPGELRDEQALLGVQFLPGFKNKEVDRG